VANGDFVRTRPESFRDRLESLAYRQFSEKFIPIIIGMENRLEFCSTFFQEKVEKNFTHKLAQMFAKHLLFFGSIMSKVEELSKK
jgi:hypothetical protein